MWRAFPLWDHIWFLFLSGITLGSPFLSGITFGSPFLSGVTFGSPFLSGITLGSPFLSPYSFSCLVLLLSLSSHLSANGPVS